MGKFINTILIGTMLLTGYSREINYNNSKGEKVNIKELKIGKADPLSYTINVTSPNGTRTVYWDDKDLNTNLDAIETYNSDGGLQGFASNQKGLGENAPENEIEFLNAEQARANRYWREGMIHRRIEKRK